MSSEFVVISRQDLKATHESRYRGGMQEFTRSIPEGDTFERAVCTQCGYIAYENPKIVTGSVVVHDDRVLLCRRAIEPRRDFWTLPAGYMELLETVEEGAVREAWEEAEARISVDGILAVFSISRIGQVQVIFRARFADVPPGASPHIAAGPESLEVGLFAWDEIPWHAIAFPTVKWALNAWRAAGDGPLGAPATNPPSDARGMEKLPEGAL